jgi:hypothetical protein
VADQGLVWLGSVPSLKNYRGNFSGSLFQVRSKLACRLNLVISRVVGIQIQKHASLSKYFWKSATSVNGLLLSSMGPFMFAVLEEFAGFAVILLRE